MEWVKTRWEKDEKAGQREEQVEKGTEGMRETVDNMRGGKKSWVRPATGILFEAPTKE